MAGDSESFDDRAAGVPGGPGLGLGTVGNGSVSGSASSPRASGRQRGRQRLDACAEPLARGAEVYLVRLHRSTVDALTRLRRVDVVRRWQGPTQDASAWPAYQVALRAEFGLACQGFLGGVASGASLGAGDGPPPERLQLVGYGEQELEAHIERAAARIRNVSYDSLGSVQRRLAALSGEVEIPANENPLRPAIFCHAFVRVLRAAGVEEAELAAALRDCEGALGQVATAAYEAVDQHLADAGLSAEVVMTAGSQYLTRTRTVHSELVTRPGPHSRTLTITGGISPGGGSAGVEAMLRALYERMELIAPLVSQEGASAGVPGPAAESHPGTLPGVVALPPSAPGPAAAHGQGTVPAYLAAVPPTQVGHGVAAAVTDGAESADQAFQEALEHVQKRASSVAVARHAQLDVGMPAAAPNEAPELLEQARRQLDKLTIQLVGMLFDRIAQDRFIPTPIKELMRELQYPMMKVAVADPALFTEPEQPARQLMDRIASTAVGWTPGGEDNDRYFAEVRKAIQVVAAEIDRGPEAFALGLEVFERYLAEERYRDDDPVARAKKALADAEAREIMAINAMIRIRSAFEGLQVESYLREFLLNTWPRVLAAVWQRDRGDEERIQRYLDAVPDLLWSVQPKTTPHDRRRLIKLIPSVLSMVREGLALIEMPAAEQQEFYSRLMSSHALAVKALELAYGHTGPPLGFHEMRDKLAGLTLPERLPAGEEMSVEIPVEVARKALASAQLDADVDLLGRPGLPDAAAEPRLEAAEPDTEVRIDDELHRWRRGDWFDLRIDGQMQRVRLRWISPRRSFYLFQPSDGSRAHSLPARVLREFLRTGALRTAGPAPLFDRLFEGLKSDRGAAPVAAQGETKPPAAPKTSGSS